MSFTLSSWLNKLVKKNIFSKLFIEIIQTRCVIDKCIFIYPFDLSCTNARLKTQELINLMHALIRLFVVSQNPELSFHWLEQNQEPGPSHIKKKPWKKRCSLNGKISVVFQNNICTFIPEIPHKQELPPHRGYSITLYFKMFSNTYYQADTFRSIKTKTTKDGNSGQNNCCP